MVSNSADKPDSSTNVAHSLWGKISILIGMFNVILSAVIFWALYSYVNEKFEEYAIIQLNIVNIGGSFELIPKIGGLVSALPGFLEKRKKRILIYYGIILNVIVLLWTVLLYAGAII